FTDAATVAKIQNGTGTLNAGSFVTFPSEVAGMNASQVEAALEINAGKGAYSTTFQTQVNFYTPTKAREVPAKLTLGRLLGYERSGSSPTSNSTAKRLARLLALSRLLSSFGKEAG